MKVIKNPVGKQKGEPRVYRGGSWYDGEPSCRSANRFPYEQSVVSRDLGFRVVVGEQK